MTEKRTPRASESPAVKRAKRLFFTNLALFALLTPVVWFLFQSGEESEADQLETEPKQTDEKPLTLLEQANLKGQIDALNEHPKTMPKFETEWVQNVSRKMILRDPAFHGASEDEIKSLVLEYYRGYSQRFNEYFDPVIARQYGYEYGLKFDPAIRPFPNFETVKFQLIPRKKELMDRYELDDAKWFLFVSAFDQGFKRGYYQTKEGITAESGSPIRLDFGK